LYAQEEAADETDLPLQTFPLDYGYSQKEVLDAEFFPEF